MCFSSRVTSSQEIISALPASHRCCEVQLRKCICNFFINCMVCGVVIIVWSYAFTTTLQGKHGGYILKAHGTDSFARHKELKAYFEVFIYLFLFSTTKNGVWEKQAFLYRSKGPAGSTFDLFWCALTHCVPSRGLLQTMEGIRVVWKVPGALKSLTDNIGYPSSCGWLVIMTTFRSFPDSLFWKAL